MRAGNIILAIVLLCLPAALAADSAVASRPDSTPPPTPHMLEIRAALDDGDRAISALRARLSPTASRAETTELKRRIARAKLESEAALLRIQASWARTEGREDLARRFESEAVAVLAPRPRDAAAAARRGPAH
jgi:hypothetical protein